MGSTESIFIQFNSDFLGQLNGRGFGLQPHGKDNHIEIFRAELPVFSSIPQGELVCSIGRLNPINLGPNESDAVFLLGTLKILVKAFSMGPHVHVENRDIKRNRAVFLCNHSPLDGSHAADR